MSLLEEKLWRGEPLLAIIKFDANTEYIVYTSPSIGTTGNFIKSINFSLSEGNNRVNPLGVATSNSISLEIYDVEDRLSPANRESPYYGKTVNGIEIDLYVSYNGTDYEPYGVYYTTNWDGSYSEGSHGLVNITAEDKLNTIGNLDMPELEAYVNVPAGDMIANVMNGIGIGPEQYTIEPSISRTLPYATTQGGKVRDFLNNICQLLFARVIIDRLGIIRFVPATRVYATANEIVLEPHETGSFTNKNTSNINYNKIVVKYLKSAGITTGELFDDSSYILNEGDTKISDIVFRTRALGISEVKIIYPVTEENAAIASIKYSAHQQGMQLDTVVTGGPVPECEIGVKGSIVSTTELSESVEVEDSSIVGGMPFEFDTQQMMSSSDALELARNLRDYLALVSRNVTMNGCVLTPKLYVGDKVTIQNTGTMYDGVYKVISLDISMGENYNVDLVMIRVN